MRLRTRLNREEFRKNSNRNNFFTNFSLTFNDFIFGLSLTTQKRVLIKNLNVVCLKVCVNRLPATLDTQSHTRGLTLPAIELFTEKIYRRMISSTFSPTIFLTVNTQFSLDVSLISLLNELAN